MQENGGSSPSSTKSSRFQTPFSSRLSGSSKTSSVKEDIPSEFLPPLQRESIKQDIPAEFLPPLPRAERSVENEALADQQVRELARMSLASSQEGVSPPFTDWTSSNPSGPPIEPMQADDVYFVDNAGKVMVTKTTMHHGRPATVTVEVGADGNVLQLVAGTARLPGESDRHYFRKMSSFARWQLVDVPNTTGISWNGDQKHPYFSILVIIITGIMLCVEIGINQGIEPFSVNPVLGPKASVLLQLGAKRADLIIAGQFQRLIAPWWLHGGILHWIVNMVALVNLGFSLEREFGTPKIAIIFCTCGFMGVLCSAVFEPNVVGVGASGAIFGLFGSCVADLMQNWGLYKSRGTAKSVLCQLVFGSILNFLLGLLPVLDQFAHLGGFFTGVSLGFVLFLQKRYTRFGEEKVFKRRQRFLQLWGLFSVPISMIILLIMLYAGIDSRGWCSWCSYINCVPIPSLWICDDSGCSDDLYYNVLQNNTMILTCPALVNHRIVTTQVDHMPSTSELIAACQALCFPH